MKSIFLWAFVLCSSLVASSSETKVPFWKKNKELYKKIQSERYLAVSVLTHDVSEKPERHKMTLIGAGHIKVPSRYAFQAAKSYDNLKRISDYVQEVKYVAPKQELYLRVSAFGYGAEVWLHIREESTKTKQILHWKVIRGTFPGMFGTLEFHKFQVGKTEISINGEYTYTDWPVHKLFLEFGLEVVLQRFGVKLRSLVESDFRKGVSYAK